MPAPLAVPAAGAAAALLKWILTSHADSAATGAMNQGLSDAAGTIKDATAKAMDLQKPYLQHAGEDYNRQRGLVQSGYYQTPYNQTYTPQQFAGPNMSFNPKGGPANFNPWMGSLNSFTPQGLPPMPAAPTQGQPPQGQQPPTMGGGTSNMAPNPQQVYDMTMRNMPQTGMMNTPSPSPINSGLPGYNTQTGQGTSPIAPYGPTNPNTPSMQDFINLLKKSPWILGKSGPLEGGMPMGGLMGGPR